MRRRHLPKLWLVTDERQGDALLPAVAALPRGAGVVFRHFRTPDRGALLRRVRRATRRRGVLVCVAYEGHGAWRAEGDGLSIVVVHDARELTAMMMDRHRPPDLVFVSPVFATRTHPGAGALGLAAFARLARRSAVPVIALGGMDARRWQRVRRLGAHGWAAVDGLTPGADQKWKAVPR